MNSIPPKPAAITSPNQQVTPTNTDGLAEIRQTPAGQNYRITSSATGPETPAKAVDEVLASKPVWTVKGEHAGHVAHAALIRSFGPKPSAVRYVDGQSADPVTAVSVSAPAASTPVLTAATETIPDEMIYKAHPWLSPTYKGDKIVKSIMMASSLRAWGYSVDSGDPDKLEKSLSEALKVLDSAIQTLGQPCATEQDRFNFLRSMIRYGLYVGPGGKVGLDPILHDHRDMFRAFHYADLYLADPAMAYSTYFEPGLADRIKLAFAVSYGIIQPSELQDKDKKPLSLDSPKVAETSSLIPQRLAELLKVPHGELCDPTAVRAQAIKGVQNGTLVAHQDLGDPDLLKSPSQEHKHKGSNLFSQVIGIAEQVAPYVLGR